MEFCESRQSSYFTFIFEPMRDLIVKYHIFYTFFKKQMSYKYINIIFSILYKFVKKSLI